MLFNRMKLTAQTEYKLMISPALSGALEKADDEYIYCSYVDTIIKAKSSRINRKEEEWDTDDDLCGGCDYNIILLFRTSADDREIKVPLSWILEIEAA